MFQVLIISTYAVAQGAGVHLVVERFDTSDQARTAVELVNNESRPYGLTVTAELLF